MNTYKLLTPGPLTTTDTVKRQMLTDRCTWDDDYKIITQKIRKKLLRLACVIEPEYTAVLMQGSGTFGVESVLSTVIGKKDKCLLIVNGAYSERMVNIATYHQLNHLVHAESYKNLASIEKIKEIFVSDEAITHVAMVHCETTTGLLNNLEDVAKLCQEYKKTLIVDAMSSFGAVAIDVKKLGIGFLISSSNKCIQGVPGFSFIIAQTALLEKCQGQARSLSLDLYDQWKAMDKDGKWRFTSPTHVVAAFLQALDELDLEGGVCARGKRYAQNNQLLRKKMAALGFQTYIEEQKQSPIISTFLFPPGAFDFQKMYAYIKQRGYVIYPGKLTDVDTFRIGNIGEIYADDIEKVTEMIAAFLKENANA